MIYFAWKSIAESREMITIVIEITIQDYPLAGQNEQLLAFPSP
jgi:hypothetical protein